MIKIAVNGAAGRMGSRILSLAFLEPETFEIVGAFERLGATQLGLDISAAIGLGRGLESGRRVSTLSLEALSPADILIDFTTPSSSLEALRIALLSNKPIVIGTTGIDQDGVGLIHEASKSIPVLFSANMSLGVNFMLELVRLATANLGKVYGYDIEISETHHRLKKDAPSGTAKEIARVVAKEMNWDLKSVARYGREGLTGERKSDELGIHVIRSGDVVGDHSVTYGGPGEVLEISHRALSRDVFAKGALVAARFLSNKTKGLYSMRDALGLHG